MKKIKPNPPAPTSQARTARPTAKSDARIKKLVPPPVQRVGGTRASRRLRGLSPDLLEATFTTAGIQLASPFPFTRLPAEIREKVYRELLVSPEVVDIDFKKPNLHPAIMRTCRAVLHEAHKILYDENTFLMRIGIPQELRNVVPVCAPKATEELSLSALTKVPNLGLAKLTRQQYISLDRDPSLRSYHHSYLNDLFPRLRGNNLLVFGLYGNWCWGGSSHPKQYYEDIKFPRRLVVSIECSAVTAGSLKDVAAILGHLPRIQHLEIRCENIPQGMWATYQGITLGEQLQAYFGGSVRRVESMAAVGVPEAHRSVLERMMKGNEPKSILLSMYEAFYHFLLRKRIFGGLPIPLHDSDNSPYTKARKAMESGDWEAFRHHREREIRGLRALGADLRDVEGIYLHDPVDWRQHGIAVETEEDAVDTKEN